MYLIYWKKTVTMNKHNLGYFPNTAEHADCEIHAVSHEQQTTGWRATSSKLGRGRLIHVTNPY